MSAIYKPTSNRLMCEICGDTAGRCRKLADRTLEIQNGQTATLRSWLCMSFSDPTKQQINGYVFRGRSGGTSAGLWGIWAESLDESIRDNPEVLAQLKREREQRLEDERLRLSKAPDADRRDRVYRDILSTLSLSNSDRESLRRRGMTDEQIAIGGYKSVTQWQKLSRTHDFDIPGVTLNGDGLVVSGPGILCPVFDVEGRIVACQLRLSNPPKNKDGKISGKYRWLSSKTSKRPNGNSHVMPNGESPITVFRPSHSEANGIGVCEGLGPKPLIAAFSTGNVMIGVAGRLFASSASILKETLDKLSNELNTKTIFFYPDAGSLLDKHTIGQYIKFFNLAEKWGYEIKVGWWDQFEKDPERPNDIDEISFVDVVDYISVVDYLRLGQSRRDPAVLKQLGSFLDLFRHRFGKSNPDVKRLDDLPKSEPRPVVTYGEGDRLDTWMEGMSSGYSYVLDTSRTGLGKSYNCGEIELPEVSAALNRSIHHVIYASGQSRNVTVQTLTSNNGWVQLKARHDGLTYDPTPDGGKRLRRRKKGESWAIPPNCARNETINAMRQKCYEDTELTQLTCQSCQFLGMCSSGAKYGYLYDRENALKEEKIVSNPNSLPSVDSHRYDKTVLIWDEADQDYAYSRQIDATVGDINDTLSWLISNDYEDILALVKPMMMSLLNALTIDCRNTRFGWGDVDLRDRLKALLPAGVDGFYIQEIMTPTLDEMRQFEGVDLSDLPNWMRAKFVSQNDDEVATLITQRYPKNWLGPLIQVLNDDLPGAVSAKSKLSIYCHAQRHTDAIKHSASTVFLSATMTPAQLALRLGVPESEIYHCEQGVEESSNLKMIQIADLGRLGATRNPSQPRGSERAANLVNALKALHSDKSCKVIDYKQYGDKEDGKWFLDSRGVNTFIDTEVLIVVGTPCRNLMSAKADFKILTGRMPEDTDPDFRAFMHEEIIAEFRQAIGRLRSHRRKDESLTVYLLTNYDLTDISSSIQLMRSSQICIEAGSKEDQFFAAISAAYRHLVAEGEIEPGEIPTQTRLSEQTKSMGRGYSQQFLSRKWNLLLSFVRAEFRGSKSEPVCDVIDAVSTTIESLRSLPEGQLVCEVETLLTECVKIRQWDQVWLRLSNTTRARVLGAFMRVLPTEFGEKLKSLISGPASRPLLAPA